MNDKAKPSARVAQKGYKTLLSQPGSRNKGNNTPYTKLLTLILAYYK